VSSDHWRAGRYRLEWSCGQANGPDGAYDGDSVLMRRFVLLVMCLVVLYGSMSLDETVALEWMRKGATLRVPPPSLRIDDKRPH